MVRNSCKFLILTTYRCLSFVCVNADYSTPYSLTNKSIAKVKLAELHTKFHSIAEINFSGAQKFNSIWNKNKSQFDRYYNAKKFCTGIAGNIKF
jgi:hypothetical protein